MTVGELKAKLALYNDDTEIFMHSWDDLSCQNSYFDPTIYDETVRTYTTKKGSVYYTKDLHQLGSKQHTILVIC